MDPINIWRRLAIAVKRRTAAQDGQALVEYALILALIALMTIGVLQALGHSVSGVLNKVGTSMASVSNP
jgi:pilus assembly protein Flp/PilA